MSEVDVEGVEAAMTLAAIAPDELLPALDLLRLHLAAPNVEARAFASAWVELGEAIAAGRDLKAPIAAFDEVIALLRRPKDERLALLALREMVNALHTNDEGR